MTLFTIVRMTPNQWHLLHKNPARPATQNRCTKLDRANNCLHTLWELNGLHREGLAVDIRAEQTRLQFTWYSLSTHKKRFPAFLTHERGELNVLNTLSEGSVLQSQRYPLSSHLLMKRQPPLTNELNMSTRKKIQLSPAPWQRVKWNMLTFTPKKAAL